MRRKLRDIGDLAHQIGELNNELKIFWRPSDRTFERERCDCYYHYLKGKLADRLHKYEDALNEYEISIAKDESRNNSTWSNLVFYRPDYGVATVLEVLLQHSSSSITLSQRPAEYWSSMVPSNQWWDNLRKLSLWMRGLKKLFQDHPTLQTGPGFLFVGIGSVEWSAYGADAGLGNWDQIDRIYRELLVQLSSAPSSPQVIETLQTLLAHRYALKAIYSGYQTNYISSAAVLREPASAQLALPKTGRTDRIRIDYTALEIDAIDELCSARKASCNSASSKVDWHKELEDLRTKLAGEDIKYGIPLGISLRLRADIDEILSKDSSAAFSFPDRTSNFTKVLAPQFDPAKDKTDQEYERLLGVALDRGLGNKQD
jgi:hypothetical protein